MKCSSFVAFKYNDGGADTISYSWDAKAYKYKIVESIAPPDNESELDQYIFVVRTRIGEYRSLDYGLYCNSFADKKTEKSTHYIDIKSEGLRDVLRPVLGECRQDLDC